MAFPRNTCTNPRKASFKQIGHQWQSCATHIDKMARWSSHYEGPHVQITQSSYKYHQMMRNLHAEIVVCKCFLYYWPFVGSPVIFRHYGPWCRFIDTTTNVRHVRVMHMVSVKYWNMCKYCVKRWEGSQIMVVTNIDIDWSRLPSTWDHTFCEC